MAMNSKLSTWQMLHKTPQQAMQEALWEQAQNLKGSSWVILTDSELIAMTGNLFLPQYLWLYATPYEDLKRFDGLNVAIRPSCEQSKKRWEAKGCGKVLSIIADPIVLVDSVMAFERKQV